MESIFGFDVNRAWDYENGFYLTSHVSRTAKLLAHYELYKSIVGLPGHVVECGVFKGASLVRFLTLRDLLESAHSRKVIGFDAFGAFPGQDDADDQAFIEQFEGTAGQGISKPELTSALERKGLLGFELVQGDIAETVPAYAAQHPELRIALLHVDVDVYSPSKVVLDHLAERVVPGGLLVFDDFGTVAGETRAVEEFMAGTSMKLEKLSLSHIPAFIRR